MTKRLFDIAFSGGLAAVLSPVILLIAGLIAATDGRPVLFRQPRVGRNGVIFDVWKFRTMRKAGDAPGSAITLGTRDARITGLGYVLRMLKLDELPQLYNVLRGDMSIVGPRPEVEEYVRTYSERQRRVLSVRPGCVDLTMVRGHIHDAELLNDHSDPETHYVNVIMPRKLEINLYYVDHRSCALDMQVLTGTAVALLGSLIRRRGVAQKGA